MKKSHDVLFLISLLCLVITGGINLLGYFNLPDIMATQISFSGGGVNTMPKAYYLIGGFVLSLLLAILVMKSKQERIKWFIAQVIIAIANVIIVLIQI